MVMGEKLLGKHSLFVVAIIIKDGTESLKLIHDNQIRIQEADTNLGKDLTQQADGFPLVLVVGRLCVNNKLNESFFII